MLTATFARHAARAGAGFGRPLLRLSTPKRAGDPKDLIKYSRAGWLTTYSVRQRYTTVLQNTSDPAIADFFFAKYVRFVCMDGPSYNYWYVTVISAAFALFYNMRQMYFNPDVNFRKQNRTMELPDRDRQHAYALPFYNHRFKNWIRKFTWMLCDNEPEWTHECPQGIRPERVSSHKRPWFVSIFTWTNYQYPDCDDAMMSSCSYGNFNRIYHDLGYKKQDDFAEKEEDD